MLESGRERKLAQPNSQGQLKDTRIMLVIKQPPPQGLTRKESRDGGLDLFTHHSIESVLECRRP